MAEEKRFYIEDEHIKDKLEIMLPFYVETLPEAKNICGVLNELYKENKELKEKLQTNHTVNENEQLIKMLNNVANHMQKEHHDMPVDDFVEWWNNIATKGLGDLEIFEKPFLKIVDDYLIEYDGDYFDLHKPADIRSLMYIINRSNGFTVLQCEYNDLGRD